MEKTVVGSFTPSVLLDVAGSSGRLDQAGLDVEEVPVTSSPAQFQALLDGDLDIALTNPDNVLAYRFNPANPLGRLADVRIVCALDRGLGLGMYGRPGLSADDLRGARVGVDVATSGFALALYALAEQFGVTRDDYELVTLGSTPRRLEALLDGRCDVTMLNAGNELVAESRGCVLLASAREFLAPYIGTVVAIDATSATSADTGRRLGRALLDTAAAVVAGELTSSVAEAAARRLELTDDLALQYAERMRHPGDGLLPSGQIQRADLERLVTLRTTYLPTIVDGVEVLDAALAEDSGLVMQP